MLRRSVLAGLPSIVAARVAAATGAPQPLVVELFTSQSCSSCPPADALLGTLARERPDLLALSFHVTYWNRLGWQDSFSLPAATERQRNYAAVLRRSAYAGTLYTPQMVIDGRRDAVGSRPGGVLAAIAAEAAARSEHIPLALGTDGAAVTIQAGAGSGRGTLWLVGFDPRHVVSVRAGENRGRRLTYTNVVRSLAAAGTWQGAPMRLQAARPEGERLALLLQAADGSILGAVRG